jgi:hypothetical protein
MVLVYQQLVFRILSVLRAPGLSVARDHGENRRYSSLV